MAERWEIPLGRLPRWGLPYATARINDFFEVFLVVSPAERYTCIAKDAAKVILSGREPGRGRRVVASDVGHVIARILRLQRLEVPTRDGRLLDIGPLTVPVAYRPESVGAGGLLGLDVLGRFSRLTFEVGPPDVLVLEREV